jgi:hypothetical protein
MIVVKYELEKEFEDAISKAFKNKNYVITKCEINGGSGDVFPSISLIQSSEIIVEGYINTDDGKGIEFALRKRL